MGLENIQDFKNIHRDKNLFILASGSSLNDCDLSKLKNKIVMGLNRSFKAYPEPYYHCVMDLRLFEMYNQEFRKARYLFTLEGRPFGVPIKLLGAEGFSFDLEEGIYTGYTICYLAMQLACYMGFKKIFFLGLDLKHEGYNTHFFGHDANTAGTSYEESEFVKMKRMLEQGAKTLRDQGYRVYNCSPVSNLKNFEKVDYEWTLQQ